MTKRDPAFLLYATDWLLSDEVSAMTLEQQGAYMRLLCFAWLHGSIPANEAALQGLLGLGSDRERFASIWSVVAGCWVVKEGDALRLVNPRQEQERAERKRRSSEMAARGQAGGQRSAQQRGGAPPSRWQAGAEAGSEAADEAEPEAASEAGREAETKPSTSKYRRDGRMDASASGLYQKGRTEGVGTRGTRGPIAAVAQDVLREVSGRG